MVLLDLVTPWIAACTAPDAARARSAFRTRWAHTLAPLQRQRAPLASQFPFPNAPNPAATDRASDPALAMRLRELLADIRAIGLMPPEHEVVLVLADVPGPAAEAVPDLTDSRVYLLMDRLGDDADLAAAYLRAVGQLTRWRSVVAFGAPDALAPPWDRWQVAREVPLAESLYAAGLAEHLIDVVLPGRDRATQLGISRAAFQRLRQHERSLRERLAADLPLVGLGPWLRWLGEGTPPSIRSDGGTPIPEGAGRYLAWRMLADRIERVGVAEAFGMPS